MTSTYRIRSSKTNIGKTLSIGSSSGNGAGTQPCISCILAIALATKTCDSSSTSTTGSSNPHCASSKHSSSVSMACHHKARERVSQPPSLHKLALHLQPAVL
ncbi:hypothetical protein GOP47_0011871 [Adiantum capillus-veneris]|uniref:Uncharacterized protein n=1 Tax=Adiantum capillus-veneris TaxID=13818 RepID=A0A9D4UTK7_ADICA|nr:hypothetical protein GOP47_0011871 [Adiantum capillus-veneris]